MQRLAPQFLTPPKTQQSGPVSILPVLGGKGIVNFSWFSLSLHSSARLRFVGRAGAGANAQPGQTVEGGLANPTTRVFPHWLVDWCHVIRSGSLFAENGAMGSRDVVWLAGVNPSSLLGAPAGCCYEVSLGPLILFRAPLSRFSKRP